MKTPRHFAIAATAAMMAVAVLGIARAQQSATEAATNIGTLYRDETAPLYKPPGYSPYADRNYPTRVLCGDTHLHTENCIREVEPHSA